MRARRERCRPPRSRVPAWLFVSAFVLSGGASGEIFKWVDDDGRVHYGDSKPPDRQSSVIEIAPAPAAEEVLRARSRLDLVREQQDTGQPEESAGAGERAAARDEEARRQRCRYAKRALHVLEMDRPVYDLDEQGNRVYLEDAQRAAQIERMRKMVKADCR